MRQGGYWRPVYALAISLDWALWNGRPGLYHVENILWHLAVVLLYPLLVYPENALFALTDISIGMQLTYLFIYAILALGLNVVVGYTGLLHLGIAAFFGIGAYIAGILTVPAVDTGTKTL